MIYLIGEGKPLRKYQRELGRGSGDVGGRGPKARTDADASPNLLAGRGPQSGPPNRPKITSRFHRILHGVASSKRNDSCPSMLAKPTPPQLFRIAHHTRVAVNCVMKTSKRTNERRLRPTSSIGLIGKSLLLSLPSQRPEPLPIAADATSSFVWLIDYRVPRRPFMQSRYYAPAAAASHCPIHPILYSAERTSRPTMDQSKKEEGKRWRRIFVRLAGG